MRIIVTRIDNPNLASHAPRVIRISDISLLIIFLEIENIIINKFIVAASSLKRILNRCLYWSDRAVRDIKNPTVLINVRWVDLISCNNSLN